MTDTDRQAALERIDRDRREQNQRVRERPWCDVCGTAVPEEDYSTKFAQAGGILAGPFCSDRCYWAFFGESEVEG